MSGNRLVGRCGCAVALALALPLGCAPGPEIVRDVPAGIGTEVFVRAPARQVFERLPRAVAAAGLSIEHVDRLGPPAWQAIVQVGGGMLSDGQWMRVTIEEAAPQLARVTAISRVKAGAGEDPEATARNVLINVIVLNAPEVASPALEPLRRGALQPGGTP